MKVLIAEDDSVSRRLLRDHLEKWGHEVIEAADGAAAWSVFESQPVPMVIADWMMPGMDGVELVRRIRALHITPYVYIILLTAKTQKADIVHGMEAGADDFVAKPFDREELRVRIKAGERVLRLERTLQEQNQALRDAEATLIQSEKFASVGLLALGVAQEINNPAGYCTDQLHELRKRAIGVVTMLDAYREARPLIKEAMPQVAEYLSQLEAEIDPATVGPAIAAGVEQCVEHLARIREVGRNMRDFAHLDSYVQREIKLNDAVAETIALARHEWEPKSVSVHTDFADGLPAISGNPGKIKKVILSLLSNAVKAVKTGGTITIRTVARPEDRGVLLVVEDDGCGIASEHLPHIFEPFYKTGRTPGRGAGLGLAIAHSIVIEHGGTIKVDSAPGRGSVFRVRLPLRPASAAAPANEGNLDASSAVQATVNA
jgi:signal transduction histidine kinase